MVQEYRITVHQKHRIVNVIALLLSLSLMLAFTACNRVKVPTSDEVKDEVEEEYEMKFKLYSEDIATFGASDYNQKDSAGFITLFGLPTKVQALVDAANKK